MKRPMMGRSGGQPVPLSEQRRLSRRPTLESRAHGGRDPSVVKAPAWRNRRDGATPDGSVSVTLRKHPYPYRAMFAICSDLDETPDHRVYREIVRFLNTLDSTAMGTGVGLEVGNSIFFMAPEAEFSYF